MTVIQLAGCASFFAFLTEREKSLDNVCRSQCAFMSGIEHVTQDVMTLALVLRELSRKKIYTYIFKSTFIQNKRKEKDPFLRLQAPSSCAKSYYHIFF